MPLRDINPFLKETAPNRNPKKKRITEFWRIFSEFHGYIWDNMESYGSSIHSYGIGWIKYVFSVGKMAQCIAPYPVGLSDVKRFKLDVLCGF
jgi:hypothetical protein